MTLTQGGKDRVRAVQQSRSGARASKIVVSSVIFLTVVPWNFVHP